MVNLASIDKRDSIRFRWFYFFSSNRFCFFPSSLYFSCWFASFCCFLKFKECVSHALCTKKVGKSAYEKCIENATLKHTHTYTHSEQPNFIRQASVKFKDFAQNFLIKHFRMLCVNGKNVQCSWMRASFSTNQNRNSHTHAKWAPRMPHIHQRLWHITARKTFNAKISLLLDQSVFFFCHTFVHTAHTHTHKQTFIFTEWKEEKPNQTNSFSIFHHASINFQFLTQKKYWNEKDSGRERKKIGRTNIQQTNK